MPSCAFAGIRIVIGEGIVHKAVNPELVQNDQKGLWMLNGMLARLHYSRIYKGKSLRHMKAVIVADELFYHMSHDANS